LFSFFRAWQPKGHARVRRSRVAKAVIRREIGPKMGEGVACQSGFQGAIYIENLAAIEKAKISCRK